MSSREPRMAVATSSPAASARSDHEELARPAGSTSCSQPGSGRDPSTVSTAILIGTGPSRARGVARSWSPSTSRMCGQYGRAYVARRR